MGAVRERVRTSAPGRTVMRSEGRAVLAKVAVMMTLQSLWPRNPR